MDSRSAAARIIDFREQRFKLSEIAGADTLRSCGRKEKKRIGNDLDASGSGMKVIAVPIECIAIRYERECEEETLAELAASISEYGVMHPISLRYIKGEDKPVYELISGARRLKAAELAGLTVIPAVVYDINENHYAVMSIIESLRSNSLHFIEEAEAYYFLMMEHGITQEELAYRIGKSQSTIANKIRLLKLPPPVKKIIREYDLSERHARALLKVRDEQLQLRALKTVCCKGFNVSKTEQLVGKLLERNIMPAKEDEFAALEAELSGDPYQIMIYEIKSFINGLKKDVEGLRRAGVITKAAQFDKEEYLEFVVRIPKAENGMKKRAH